MRKSLLGILGVLTIFFGVSQGDMVIKHKISSVFPAMEMETSQNLTEYISKNKARFENETEISSPFVTKYDSNGKKTESAPLTSIDLYDLEKGINFCLTPDRKFYDKYDLSSRKKNHEEYVANRQTSEDSNYTWSYGVNPTDSILIVCGYHCKGMIGFAVGINAKNPSDSIIIASKQWRTDSIAGISEVIDFHAKLTELNGGDAVWTQEGMERQVGAFENQFKHLAEEMNRFIPGYPMKTVFITKKPLNEHGILKYNKYPYSDEVIGIEIKEIDKNLFELPQDYKARK